MEQNDTFSQHIDSLFNNLQDFTRNESVLGTPVTYGTKTLIPVIGVTLGYGSGSMSTNKNQQAGISMNPGSGLGIGAKVATDAVIVIDENNVSLLPITAGANAGNMMDKLPQMLGNLKGGQQGQQQQGQQQQGQQQQGQQSQ